MGLRSGLPHLGSPRRCVADLAAPIQLAPAAQQSTIKSAHQPPRSYRGQPVEAPHLAHRDPRAHQRPLLVLHLIHAKEQERGKQLLRLRIAEISLKRVWGRRRISPEFVEEVAEWLSGAGVTLFFAGSTYAAVKTSVVESWPRVTSKRIRADVK